MAYGPHDSLVRALETITWIASTAPTVTDGLTRTLDVLCEALHWPLGHVYCLADEDGEKLTSASLWHLEQPQQFGAFQEETQRVTFHPGRGLVGQVFAEGRPGLSADVSRDPRFVRRRSARAEGVHGWCAFPVIAEGRVVAVCEFFTTERGAPDPSLTGLLRAAGLALGRLYERERWWTELEALRRQLAERTEATPEPDRATLSALAGAVAHEVNSPLFAARASLALLGADRPGDPLVVAAQAELARIAAVMEQLNTLAQAAPLGQRLERVVGAGG